MAHALVLEGSDIVTRDQLDVTIEQLGHEMRAAMDEEYKRATWGRRPEDIAEQQAFMGELAGKRA